MSAAAGFLRYLETLPRFDPELGTDALQGDRVPGLKNADATWKKLKGTLSPRELQQLYAHEQWSNFRKLRSHTAAFLAWRRKRDAERYSELTAKDKTDRAQRARVQRAHKWFEKNKDRLAAEIRRLGLAGVHPHILQEIERRYRDRASNVYLLLQVRVALDTGSPARRGLLEMLRQVAPDHPLVTEGDQEVATEAVH